MGFLSCFPQLRGGDFRWLSHRRAHLFFQIEADVLDLVERAGGLDAGDEVKRPADA